MKVTMRCVGGPYAGQTLTVPRPRYVWNPYAAGPVPYLVNVFDGRHLHCYLTVPSKFGDGWHLKYQEEF